MINISTVEVLHLLEELRNLSRKNNSLLNQNEILLLEGTILDKIRIDNPPIETLKPKISNQIKQEFENIMNKTRLNSSKQKRVLQWIQEKIEVESNKKPQTELDAIQLQKSSKNFDVSHPNPVPPSSSPKLYEKINKSDNYSDQLGISLKQELTINWFLFLGAFMVFASGLFYCFLTWTNFNTVQQFLASLGGIAFFFTLEFILSRGIKLVKSPRIFAMIFVLFLPMTLWVQIRLGLVYYLIGLCFGIPALLNLKKQYYPDIDRAWLGNIILLILIPVAANIHQIQLESIENTFIIIACISMLVIQYYGQKGLQNKKMDRIPTAITAWFYICLHFCFFSIFNLIFAFYTVCAQLVIFDKPPKFAYGFLYGSFAAMTFFYTISGSFTLFYFGVALFLFCMHKIHIQNPTSTRSLISQISSMIWIFLCPLVLHAQTHIELFLLSNLMALIYFSIFTRKHQFHSISRCLIIYGFIPLTIFYDSAIFLSLHLFTLTICIHYLISFKTEEDLLTESLMLSLGILSLISWHPHKFGLLAFLWLAISIILRSKLTSIRPFILLSTSFLILGTIQSIEFWGVLILITLLFPNYKQLKGNIFIIKYDLFLLLFTIVIYAINTQHLGILISLGCSGLYFLVEAYRRKIESLVYVGFLILFCTYFLAKSLGYIGSYGLTTYGLLVISILFYAISLKLKSNWKVFTRPFNKIARFLPLLSIFLEYLATNSAMVYFISGIFYHFIQDESKLSYSRLLSLLSFNIFIFSIFQTSGFIIEIISICSGFSVLWYAKNLEEKISLQKLKGIKLIGNICFYFGALFDFVFNVSLEPLLFCWLICALGGWLALLTRAKMQLIFAASIFVLTLSSFVIKQLYFELSSGIPLIAGIGLTLIFIAVFIEKFKDTWVKFIRKLQRLFSDWSD